MIERWLPVVGEEDRYEVSSLGRVRNRKTGRLRKLARYPSGHMGVQFWTSGPSGSRERRKHAVHRMVLAAFVGECPPGLEGCHNDGNPGNNTVENLRWDTRASNAADRVRHGQDGNARKTHCKRGHAYTDSNTYRPSTAGAAKRQCRSCHSENEARYRAGRRAS